MCVWTIGVVRNLAPSTSRSSAVATLIASRCPSRLEAPFCKIHLHPARRLLQRPLHTFPICRQNRQTSSPILDVSNGTLGADCSLGGLSRAPRRANDEADTLDDGTGLIGAAVIAQTGTNQRGTESNAGQGSTTGRDRPHRVRLRRGRSRQTVAATGCLQASTASGAAGTAAGVGTPAAGSTAPRQGNAPYMLTNAKSRAAPARRARRPQPRLSRARVEHDPEQHCPGVSPRETRSCSKGTTLRSTPAIRSR